MALPAQRHDEGPGSVHGSRTGAAPSRGSADPGESRPGPVRPCRTLQGPAPKLGLMRRILQDPAGSCTQSR
eukprot:2121584-Pyramimonas_sp.AAC.1